MLFSISGEAALVERARSLIIAEAEKAGEPAPNPVPVSGAGDAVHPPWAAQIGSGCANTVAGVNGQYGIHGI